jgi:hypothetical protein
MTARCQSCVIPLPDAAAMGTTADGGVQPLHCNSCMVKGALDQSLHWPIEQFLPMYENVGLPDYKNVKDPETIKKYIAMLPTMAYWKAKGLMESGNAERHVFTCQVCGEQTSAQSTMGTDSTGFAHPLFCDECFVAGVFTPRVRGSNLASFTRAMRDELVGKSAMSEQDVKKGTDLFPTLLYWQQLPSS